MGLGASVWSKNVAKAYEIAARIETGTVWINQHMALNPVAPFGGHKESGIGVELGLDGLKSYCNKQVIFVAR